MDQNVVGFEAGSRERAIEVFREIESEFEARVEGRAGR